MTITRTRTYAKKCNYLNCNWAASVDDVGDGRGSGKTRGNKNDNHEELANGSSDCTSDGSRDHNDTLNYLPKTMKATTEIKAPTQAS